MHMRSDIRGDAGFTLVEVAMALLIAGLGVLSVFSVFPQGMEASRRSVQATEITAFADLVMNTLEMDAGSPSYNWASFANDAWDGPKSHAIAYVGTTQNVVRALGDDPPDVQVFQITPNYLASIGNETRYFATATFTYTLDIGDVGPGRKYARLEVWGGDRAQAVRDAKAANRVLPERYVFYREFTWYAVEATP